MGQMKCPRDESHTGVKVTTLWAGMWGSTGEAFCAECGEFIKGLERSEMLAIKRGENPRAALERVERLIAACRQNNFDYLDRIKAFRHLSIEGELHTIADVIQEVIEGGE